jgi:hypothetical protein
MALERTALCQRLGIDLPLVQAADVIAALRGET